MSTDHTPQAEPQKRGELETVHVPCPLCGSERHQQVCRSRDYVYAIAGDWTFVACVDCGHMFLNPRPSLRAIMQCYPDSYGPHLATAAAGPAAGPAAVQDSGEPDSGEPDSGASGLRWMLRRLPGLRRFLCWLGEEQATVMPSPPQPGHSRLLEIGCAHGSYLARGLAAGWVVAGVEPSRAAAEVARGGGFSVITASVDEHALPEAHYQAVVAWMVLEHLPDPVATLNKLGRTLAPGGVLAVSVPNASCLDRAIFGRYWQGYDPPRHLQVFRSRQFRELLERLGYAQVRIIYQSCPRDWIAGFAAWGSQRFPAARWPVRLMEYFRGDPPRWLHWLLVGPAKCLAVCRLSGRITVLARRGV